MSGSEQRSTVGYIVVTLAAVAALVYLLQQPTDPDIAFGRRVFSALARGRMSAQDQVDWEHLKALETDVGHTYQAFQTEPDRLRYQQSFILGFSQGFRATGGHLRDFSHWRVVERNGTTVTVAMDNMKHHKTLLLVIATDSPKRLLAIRWGEPT